MNKVDELIHTLSSRIEDEWADELEFDERYGSATPDEIKMALLFYCVTWTDGMIDDDDELQTETFIVKRWNKLSSENKTLAEELFNDLEARCSQFRRIQHGA